MSVDISWDLITSGPDGEALAESIRAFIHAKFQQITLPRFINAVHVHSFHFGSVCPEIEIKEICDPLPDFYEEEEEEDDDDDDDGDDYGDDDDDGNDENEDGQAEPRHLQTSRNAVGVPGSSSQRLTTTADDFSMAAALPTVSPKLPRGDSHSRRLDTPLSAPFARSGTPGIPGGTSNMSYFHFPMAGLSGAQTPLAAVAGGGPFGTHAWLNDQHSRLVGTPVEALGVVADQHEAHARRHGKTGSISPPELDSPRDPSSPEKKPYGLMAAEKVSDEISSGVLSDREVHPPSNVSPNDIQVVARVNYNGDIQMLLTAEVMLDYPMPSFIKIPLKMSITGATFDGVAIVAYIKRKMHFCFLDPEDAETILGRSTPAAEPQPPNQAGRKASIAGLLREIRVETEIGRQESGKQVLKNVGKVERFVLEQVRRIFEDEFVFPSFWTFLV